MGLYKPADPANQSSAFVTKKNLLKELAYLLVMLGWKRETKERWFYRYLYIVFIYTHIYICIRVYIYIFNSLTWLPWLKLFCFFLCLVFRRYGICNVRKRRWKGYMNSKLLCPKWYISICSISRVGWFFISRKNRQLLQPTSLELAFKPTAAGPSK